MTYRVLLVESVPCLSGNGDCQQQGSLDDLGEVHLEVLSGIPEKERGSVVDLGSCLVSG